jgi:hypothetical protein
LLEAPAYFVAAQTLEVRVGERPLGIADRVVELADFGAGGGQGVEVQARFANG